MLNFTENGIHQSCPGIDKVWGIPELLEIYNPLFGEPLKERNAAIRQLMPMAGEMFGELTEAARLHYDFWKQLVPKRIEEQRFSYSIKASGTYHWELTVNADGLFYKDVSGQFSSTTGGVSEQLHSDFWFYGPMEPMPDLETRKWVLATIRNAFMQAGSPASYAHFELFEYPHLESPKAWETGDTYRQDSVTLHNFGLELGSSNWRDMIPQLSFFSFEFFISQPWKMEDYFSPEMRAGIEQHLARRGGSKPARDVLAPEPNAESKRLFMENGGNVHYIHRDGFGDVYEASPSEETAWRKELVEKYAQRLREEDNETRLGLLLQTLEYNGAENLADLLCEAAESALPKAKMALTKLLYEKYDPERGVEIHLTLLELEEQDSYWRDYVFRILFQQRNNPVAQRFVMQCLRGDNEAHFRKAVDVLQMWGYYGDKAFADRELLMALNWQDACAADPNFTHALEKVIRLMMDGGRPTVDGG
jgi:hypothetical protein